MRRICRLRAAGSKGIFSFAKENIPFGTPRERLRLAVSGLNNSDVSEVKVPRARRSRVSIAIRFASASIIRCRSAHLVGVQLNFRLPWHSSMRRAQQCRLGTQSAAEQTSLAPHGSKARLRVVTKRRGSWRSHVHRTRLRSACSSSSYKLAMLGVEGRLPSPFSGGFKGGILFGKRIPPFAASPHGVGIKRNSPRGLLSSRARGAKVVQIVNMGYLSPFPLFFLWIICGIDFWRFRG